MADKLESINGTALAALGRTAGLAGIAIGAFVLIFRDVLQQRFLATLPLEPGQAGGIVLALLVLTFGISVIGVVAWLVGNTHRRKPVSNSTLLILGGLALAVLAATTFAGSLSGKPPTVQTARPAATDPAPPAPIVQQSTSGPGSPVVHDVRGDVTITVDQSSSKSEIRRTK